MTTREEFLAALDVINLRKAAVVDIDPREGHGARGAHAVGEQMAALFVGLDFRFAEVEDALLGYGALYCDGLGLPSLVAPYIASQLAEGIALGLVIAQRRETRARAPDPT